MQKGKESTAGFVDVIILQESDDHIPAGRLDVF